MFKNQITPQNAWATGPLPGRGTAPVVATPQGRCQPLSQLFADPFLKAVFERAERDQGDAAAAAITPTPDLDGDDHASVQIAELV